MVQVVRILASKLDGVSEEEVKRRAEEDLLETDDIKCEVLRSGDELMKVVLGAAALDGIMMQVIKRRFIRR